MPNWPEFSATDVLESVDQDEVIPEVLAEMEMEDRLKQLDQIQKEDIDDSAKKYLLEATSEPRNPFGIVMNKSELAAEVDSYKPYYDFLLRIWQIEKPFSVADVSSEVLEASMVEEMGKIKKRNFDPQVASFLEWQGFFDKNKLKIPNESNNDKLTIAWDNTTISFTLTVDNHLVDIWIPTDNLFDKQSWDADVNFLEDNFRKALSERVKETAIPLEASYKWIKEAKFDGESDLDSYLADADLLNWNKLNTDNLTIPSDDNTIKLILGNKEIDFTKNELLEKDENGEIILNEDDNPIFDQDVLRKELSDTFAEDIATYKRWKEVMKVVRDIDLNQDITNEIVGNYINENLTSLAMLWITTDGNQITLPAIGNSEEATLDVNDIIENDKVDKGLLVAKIVNHLKNDAISATLSWNQEFDWVEFDENNNQLTYRGKDIDISEITSEDDIDGFIKETDYSLKSDIADHFINLARHADSEWSIEWSTKFKKSQRYIEAVQSTNSNVITYQWETIDLKSEWINNGEELTKRLEEIDKVIVADLKPNLSDYMGPNKLRIDDEGNVKYPYSNVVYGFNIFDGKIADNDKEYTTDSEGIKEWVNDEYDNYKEMKLNNIDRGDNVWSLRKYKDWEIVVSWRDWNQIKTKSMDEEYLKNEYGIDFGSAEDPKKSSDWSWAKWLLMQLNDVALEENFQAKKQMFDRALRERVAQVNTDVVGMTKINRGKPSTMTISLSLNWKTETRVTSLDKKVDWKNYFGADFGKGSSNSFNIDDSPLWDDVRKKIIDLQGL